MGDPRRPDRRRVRGFGGGRGGRLTICFSCGASGGRDLDDVEEERLGEGEND